VRNNAAVSAETTGIFNIPFEEFAPLKIAEAQQRRGLILTDYDSAHLPLLLA
jgi:hypothetical protein